MAEEFIDLYEVLELPIETDRNTLRKRVNELYLDAQRNLDHRNFQTRIKFQELYEITLPQARYILLDDGRRDDYDRLVRAFRASKAGGSAPPPTAESVAVAPESNEPGIPGTSPEITALPQANADPAQLAKEREELWSKWKSGLETVLAEKEDEAPKVRGNTHSLPPGGGAAAAPKPKGAPTSDPVARPAGAPAARPAKAKVSFNFGEGGEVKRPATSAEEAELEKQKAKKEEQDRRRDHHRREIIKETLVNVGLIWTGVGIAAVVVPGLIALLLISNFVLFPFGKKPPVPAITQPIFWGVGLLILVAGGVFTARSLSRSKRQEAVSSLSRMSYEDLLKRVGKS